MSTKYYKARHTTDTTKTAQVANLRADTDSAHSTLSLLVALNQTEPLKKGNWKISITNYDGSKTIQKNLNWKNLTLNLRAEDLFSIIG